MRNLVLLTDVLLGSGTPSASEAVALGCDDTGDRVCVLTRAGRLQCLARRDSGDAASTGAATATAVLWEVALDADAGAGDANWISMTIVADLEAVFCASSAGRLVLADVATGSVTEVGAIANGVRAVAWAPDQEVVAIATGGDTLLAMTSTWGVLGEVPTGAHAKDAPLSLCWRGDSAFLASSSVDAATGERLVRVWTRELEFHSEGRNEDGSAVTQLGPALAWSTDNALVGATQRVPCGAGQTRLQVSFFERNGLRHRELVLSGVDPERCRVTWMDWNAAEADLLAVLLQPPAQGGGRGGGVEGDVAGESASSGARPPWSVLQLWHRNNFRWYLKRELRFGDVPAGVVDSGDGDGAPGGAAATSTSATSAGAKGHELPREWLSAVAWDPERPYRLLLSVMHGTDAAGAAASVRALDFAWDPTVSSGPAATAAVCDGRELLLTPLRDAIVPPPMSYESVTLPAPISEIAFDPPAVEPAGTDAGVTDADADAGASDSGEGAVAEPTLAHGAAVDTGAPGDRAVVSLLSDGSAMIVDTVMVPAKLRRHPDAPSTRCGPRARLPLAAAAGCRAWTLRHVTWLGTSADTAGNAAAGGDRDGAERAQHILAVCNASHTVAGSVAGVESLIEFVASGPSGSDLALTRTSVPRPVYRVCRWRAGEAILQLDDGSLMVYHSAMKDGGPCLVRAGALPEPCAWLGVLATRAAKARVVSAREAALSASVGGVGGVGRGALLVARSDRMRLYVGDTLHSPACSGLLIHARHGFLVHASVGPMPALLFSSRDSLLRATAGAGGAAGAADADATMNASTGEGFMHDLSSARLLERGARMVAVVPDDDRVVLQMPRGNLEAIAPRALVLAGVRTLLDASAYGEAIEVLRRHRVDMNIVVDHNRAQFEAEVERFVALVNSGNRLDLFLTALADEDVTVTKYPVGAKAMERAAQRRAGDRTVGVVPGKVNDVCRLVRAAIREVAPGGRLLTSELTSFIVERPPKLEDALRRVQEVALAEVAGSGRGFISAFGDVRLPDADAMGGDDDDDDDDDGGDDAGASADGGRGGAAGAATAAAAAPTAAQSVARTTADAALKHVILLSDVDRLFDVALGMYELGLVSLVARRSQKDPKEYVPFLKWLAGLPPAQARFEIDTHLKRFGKALASLAQMVGDAAAAVGDGAGDAGSTGGGSAARLASLSDNAVKLTVTHKLYAEALALFPQAAHPALHRRLLLAFADHEEAMSHMDEAAAARASARPPDTDGAIRCAVAARDWRFALNVAAMAGRDAVEMSRIASTLAGELRSEGAEGARVAAQLLVQYCDDVDEAAVVLTSANEFADAAHVALANKRRDLVETIVRPGALGRQGQLLEELGERRAAFDEAVTKLAVCRNTRKEKLQALARARAEAAARAAAGGDEDDDGASGAGGGGGASVGGGGDGAASVWTDATGSTMWTAASGASRSSTSSARSAGMFSHVSALDLGSTLFSDHAGTSVSGPTEIERRRARKTKRKMAKKHKRDRRGQFRPGTAEEEAHHEKALAAARPPAQLQWDVRAVASYLVLDGSVAEARRVQRALGDLLAHMAENSDLPEATAVLIERGELPQDPAVEAAQAEGAGDGDGVAAGAGSAGDGDGGVAAGVGAGAAPEVVDWQLKCLA